MLNKNLIKKINGERFVVVVYLLYLCIVCSKDVRRAYFGR